MKIFDALVKIKKYTLKHKIISLVVLILIVAGGYFGYKYFNKESAQTRYILSAVEKGTITTSISGTGQISAKDTKDIKAETSGEIVYLNAKEGSSVSKGTLIAQIDTKDAQSNIKDAQQELESAKIALNKLIGSDESNPKAIEDAKEMLEKSYEDGYNTVSSAFLELPTIMKGLDDILYGSTFNNYQTNLNFYTYVTYTYNDDVIKYKDAAEKSYETARSAYNKNFNDYKASNRYSDTATIDSLISETYETSKDIAQAIKDTINLIQYYEDTLTHYSIKINSGADTHLTSLSSYLSKTNSNISSLFSANSTIDNNEDGIDDAKTEIDDAKLTVEKKEKALSDAKSALSDCYVYSPINGVFSAVSADKGDNVSSGSTIATVITNSKIAQITLSETDVVNVKVGDKATITFDAIDDLTMTGQVTQVDLVGSSSSGVVSYGVEITLDENSDKVKSGMSISATIITNSKTDTLIIPTTAVKSNDDGTYYVQVLSDAYDLTNKSLSIKGVTSSTAPTTKVVTIGLADDTNTEITGGLAEGDQVVLRVSSSATSSASSNSSKNTNKSNSIINTGGVRIQSGGIPPGM